MTNETSRYLGGMNLDRPLGGLRRANATIPLAVMTIAMDDVRIEPIRLLSRVLPSIRLSRDQVVSVYRSTGLLTPGVAVKESGGVVHGAPAILMTSHIPMAVVGHPPARSGFGE